MIKNYFKTALRNLWKNKYYSSINIVGLAAGLAVGIMILMWVNDELSYDSFHRNGKNIYTVISNMGTSESRQSSDYVPASVAPFSLREIPEVKQAARFTENFDFSLITYKDKEFTERRMAYADPSIFSVFDFKLKIGNPDNAFPDNNSVVISESTAKKYFGNENPIGKILQADKRENFTVSGIMEDIPTNSSIQFDIFFPFDILVKNFVPNIAWKSLETDWGNYNYATFLLVHAEADISMIEKKLTALQRKHNSYDKGSYYTLQPLLQKHLFAPDGSAMAFQTVRVFFIVAILLLLIACINYVNLSTARSMIRSKEVSIRKIVGAARMQLFFQFVCETAILFVLSSLLALCMIYILMPVYNEISGKNLPFSFTDTKIWSIIGLTILSALILSSIYPALLLSSFKPLQVLKGKLSFGLGNAFFRKVLVTVQFVFSVGLIIATLVIDKQMKYVREKELGYDKEYVLSFPAQKLQEHYEAVKTELLNSPGVMGLTSASQDILNSSSMTGDTDWDGKEPNQMFLIHPIGVDKDFLDLFKLKLVSGKKFSGTKIDSTHFILNETAIREAGIRDPIGKRFTLWQTEGTIIGVVKDFHFESLKQRIEPAIFFYSPSNPIMLVKTTGRDAQKAIEAATAQWKHYNAGFPFEYQFLDETYDRMYRTDQQTGLLFRIFAVIAILISCLGLLGLATYTAHVKVKEIGIRKVLGASIINITGMLSKDFLKLVFIAIVIASPIAWYFMQKWLQDYVYRVNISWWIFLVGGISAVVIALVSVSFQAIRAAVANPVKSLRTE